MVEGSKQKARCGRQAEMCVCLSVQLLKTIHRKISKPVEKDVGMAIIRCALTEL
jgi:hypothetical protein